MSDMKPVEIFFHGGPVRGQFAVEGAQIRVRSREGREKVARLDNAPPEIAARDLLTKIRQEEWRRR